MPITGFTCYELDATDKLFLQQFDTPFKPIKTVTVNVGEKGGVTIVDDLPADETPYVNYTPMYYPSSVDADGSNLCVAGRDKDCNLNATYAYDKATVHIPSGTTSNLVVTNREAEK